MNPHRLFQLVACLALLVGGASGCSSASEGTKAEEALRAPQEGDFVAPLLANDLTAKLLKERKLTDPDTDGIFTYFPRPLWQGGNAIAFPLRTETEFRRLSGQLKQHMELWF